MSDISTSSEGSVGCSADVSVSSEESGFHDLPLSQPSPSPFDGFDIRDPLELLFMLDDDIASGSVTLHKWQVQYLTDFASKDFKDTSPFQSIVRACNGSGKDKYIIAPCVVWLCMRYQWSTGVVTSSSGAQLDNQTCRYIEDLCNAANRVFCSKVWTCNYRYYRCDFGSNIASEIFCYATDEPGKAEGYHPLKYGAKMGIFVSEDKSVPDEINIALNKCTGYTHRAHVSTPGLPMGHFFDYDSTAILRSSLKNVDEAKPGDYIKYHVTAYDCSHISRAYIEQMKRDLPGGEFGAAFKSQVMAEFGTTDEMVVIPYTYIWQAIHNQIKYIPEAFNKAGLDLSDGGDETVLIVRNGNKHLATVPFKFDNTEDSIAFLNEKFIEHDLNHPESYIFADCGGLGKPMLDRLKGMGWHNIRYIDNRAKARYPKTYLNRGTELWFHTGQLLQRRELILQNDNRLIRQLSTRYYKIDINNRHRLLSKLESRAKGYPSPDRADALVLSFWDYRSTFNESPIADEAKLPFKSPPTAKPVNDFTLRNWAKGSEQNAKSFFRSRRVRDYNYYYELIDHHNKNIRLAKQTTK